PSITAGDPGHIALTFPGTKSADRDDGARPWDSWVVVSTNALDANPLFVANIGNSATDPVHRGNCTGRCAGMFDFLDVVGSPSDGTVWASAVDTCTAQDNCHTVAATGEATDMRRIGMKESAGPRRPRGAADRRREVGDLRARRPAARRADGGGLAADRAAGRPACASPRGGPVGDRPQLAAIGGRPGRGARRFVRVRHLRLRFA